MGYRSEVVLALHAKIVPAFMCMFAKNEEAQKLCTVHMDTLETDYQGEGNWLVVWNDIKWYDSYPDVGPISRFIEALSADDLSEYGINTDAFDEGEATSLADYYSYCRIGEDSDDAESHGWGFDGVAVQRTISY